MSLLEEAKKLDKRKIKKHTKKYKKEHSELFVAYLHRDISSTQIARVIPDIMQSRNSVDPLLPSFLKVAIEKGWIKIEVIK